ncbi:hypothetical protein BLNAU_11732 [Blattamonas nauphoetae]|uniref:Uncharacterized protein n=1 Tax=Blattamonas nauphoetae TaxID=2049346 RepID=A0ABQ9XNE7_9EUKA|nr:hypothetical protein BLNAU_11732 [Blattamonas nauphoetae]
MTEISKTINTSLSATRSDLPSSQFSFSMDCSAFLNWDEEEELESESEIGDIFQSLVATIKLQPGFDDTLETKAVKFLESVYEVDEESADAFLGNFGETSDDSPTDFVQSIVVLLSSSSQAITTATMKMLKNVVYYCSAEVLLPLVEADLIPQLINTLHPLSLSPTEAVDIPTSLISIISDSLRLATLSGLEELENDDSDETQAVCETVVQQVLIPSAESICHLCVNRFPIVDGEESERNLTVLTRILQLCPYNQPTMDLVLRMSVVLPIPSCLTIVDKEQSIFMFLYNMNNAQWEWNDTKGEQQQMWKTVHQMLRMEGIEDVVEEKLQNDQRTSFGGDIVVDSMEWNNQLGMNLPKQE